MFRAMEEPQDENQDSWNQFVTEEPIHSTLSCEEYYYSSSEEDYFDYSFEIAANIIVNTQLQILTEYRTKIPPEEILSTLKQLEKSYGKERLANWIQDDVSHYLSKMLLRILLTL